MANILSESQCQKIKALNRKFEPYAEKGWMCEGSDKYGLCNCIFNNDTDEVFWASYSGIILDEYNVKDTSLRDMTEMAKIQGDISKACRN